MKHLSIFSLSALLLLGFVGCDDSFNPKEEFQPKIIVTGLLKADSSRQNIVIQKSYDIPGFDPSQNTTDPFISGANVVLKVTNRKRNINTTHILRDTSRARAVGSKYPGPMPFYTTTMSGFNKITARDTITLIATLPSGEKIESTTIVPEPLNMEINRTVLTTAAAKQNIDRFLFTWVPIDNAQGFMYYPRMRIYYDQMENGVVTPKNIEVPIAGFGEGAGRTYSYPLFSKSRYQDYLFSIVDEVMRDISKNDVNKQNFYVRYAKFDLMVYDVNFAKYYSSINGFLDDLSVRIDEVVYSNIPGGLGFLGVTKLYEVTLPIDLDYTSSFGYRVTPFR